MVSCLCCDGPSSASSDPEHNFLWQQLLCNQALKRVVFFLSLFLGQYPRHIEVPRLGVELELQLSAYTTATAMQDLSLVCDLYHSPWQRQILNPLSEARDRTCALMDASQICFH